MPSLFKSVESKISGIKCDNCDYRDDSVKYKEYEHYLHAPCPKCGHILLTESDYNICKAMVKATLIFNIIYFPIHFVKYIFSKKYRNMEENSKIELAGNNTVKVSGGQKEPIIVSSL